VNTVTSYQLGVDGALSHQQQLPTLPGPGTPWSPNAHGADSATSEIVVDKSGRYMYAGNRHQGGHEEVRHSLGCFLLDAEDGSMSAAPHALLEHPAQGLAVCEGLGGPGAGGFCVLLRHGGRAGDAVCAEGGSGDGRAGGGRATQDGGSDARGMGGGATGRALSVICERDAYVHIHDSRGVAGLKGALRFCKWGHTYMYVACTGLRVSAHGTPPPCAP
jgi:hypothetical protein